MVVKCIKCGGTYPTHKVNCKHYIKPTVEDSMKEQVLRNIDMDAKTLDETYITGKTPVNTILTESSAEYREWDKYKQQLYTLGCGYVTPNGTEKQDRDVLIAGLVAKVQELEVRLKSLETEIEEWSKGGPDPPEY